MIRGMSNPLRFVFVLVLVVGLAGCGAGESGELAVGGKAPNFKAKNLAGESAGLKDFLGDGQFVLLNFWATWCSPCQAEIPTLNKVHERFGGKGLKVVSLSVEEREDTLRNYLAKTEIKYPVYLDPKGEIGAKYGLLAVPLNVIIDPDGKVVSLRRMAFEESLVQDVEALLKP